MTPETTPKATHHAKVMDLVNSANELIKFIDKENDLLLKNDAGLSEEHNTQKDVLIRTYEGYVNNFQEHSADMNSLNEDVRDEVKSISDKLKDVIAKNVIRLRARYEANMMMLESYAKAVNEVSAGNISYAGNGEIVNNSSSQKSRPKAATLNQSL